MYCGMHSLHLPSDVASFACQCVRVFTCSYVCVCVCVIFVVYIAFYCSLSSHTNFCWQILLLECSYNNKYNCNNYSRATDKGNKFWPAACCQKIRKLNNNNKAQKMPKQIFFYSLNGRRLLGSLHVRVAFNFTSHKLTMIKSIWMCIHVYVCVYRYTYVCLHIFNICDKCKVCFSSILIIFWMSK